MKRSSIAQVSKKRLAQMAVKRERLVASIPAGAVRSQGVSMAGKARASVQVPKPQTIQNEAYMAAVRTLKCAHCGWPPPSQFCHSDMGKGGAIKSDCREGWPGCGPHFVGGVMVNGCHHDVGTARIYPKEVRREVEADMARLTRAEILARGLWPKRLPLY